MKTYKITIDFDEDMEDPRDNTRTGYIDEKAALADALAELRP